VRNVELDDTLNFEFELSNFVGSAWEKEGEVNE
jgi:hypothetical protein